MTKCMPSKKASTVKKKAKVVKMAAGGAAKERLGLAETASKPKKAKSKTSLKKKK